jgi:hypothetical protein
MQFTTRQMMAAVAIVGLISGGTIELVRRHQRFLLAYREQALAEFECSAKAQIVIGTMGARGIIPLRYPRSHRCVAWMPRSDGSWRPMGKTFEP